MNFSFDGSKNKLQYNLVFEASVEVFVREHNRVEYNHLGRDIHVTA